MMKCSAVEPSMTPGNFTCNALPMRAHSKSHTLLFLLLAACACSKSPAPPAKSAVTRIGDSTIVVGANVRVSLDGDFGHVEAPIAASPRDPNLLMAAATVLPDGFMRHTRVYVSTDRGATWQTAIIPYLMGPEGSVDPSVAIDPKGRMYVTSAVRFMTGETLWSVDSGKTWNGPTTMGPNFRMAVDRSDGPRSGNVYLGLSHMDTLAVPVQVSSDGGRTYQNAGRSCNSVNNGMLTLSDGAVMVICMAYNAKTRASEFRNAVSVDGGRTFAPEHVIAGNIGYPREDVLSRLQKGRVLPPTNVPGDPCATNAIGTAYRDRVHCVWGVPDTLTFTMRLYTSYSSDRGVTWSAPKLVDSSIPKDATQSLPMIAVNKDGVVGIAWLDSRQSSKRDRHDLYFAASRDGGETYLPVVRVSSASSFPMGAGNLRPNAFPPRAIPDPKVGPTVGDEMQLVSNALEYGREIGGDYGGLAADAAGDFHPVWPDARDGTWQLYSARITVAPAGATFTMPDTSQLERVKMVRRASMRMESSAIDTSTLQLMIQTRIQNTSQDTLYGPFTIEVVAIDSGRTLANSSNDKNGVGAQFTFAQAAGTRDLLPPGAVTEAMPLRFRIPAREAGDIRFQSVIYGYLRKSTR
jgi:hypothetical protein